MDDDDLERLSMYIDDDTTLHQPLAIDHAIYTKVDDRVLGGSRYVLLKIRLAQHADCLQVMRKTHATLWKSVCVYYVEVDIWNFDDEDVMTEAIAIIGEYKQKMAMFE